MLAITLAVGAVAVVAVYWASRVAMGAGADLRTAVFTRVQGFSAREVNGFGTPSLITRNTNDIQQIQLFLQMALMVMAPIMCVGGVIMALREGLALSPLLAVAVPVMAVVIGAMLVLVVPQFRSMQGKIDRINQVLREQITGVRVIRAFVRGGAENRRFARLRPERAWLAAAILLGVASVGFMVAGPKILGNATNVLFDGVVGKQLPAGMTQAQAIALLRAHGHGQLASILAGMSVTPGAGVDITRLGRVLGLAGPPCRAACARPKSAPLRTTTCWPSRWPTQPAS
jgi:ATP-binding cassette, subfamily B, multidrug efflux pump